MPDDNKKKITISKEKTKIKFHQEIKLSDIVYEGEGASTEKFKVDPKTLPVPKSEADAEGMARTWFNKAKSEQDKERSSAYLAVSKKYTQLALKLGKEKTLGDNQKESMEESYTDGPRFLNYMKQKNWVYDDVVDCDKRDSMKESTWQALAIVKAATKERRRLKPAEVPAWRNKYLVQLGMEIGDREEARQMLNDIEFELGAYNEI
jgi:hypothetical protein